MFDERACRHLCSALVVGVSFLYAGVVLGATVPAAGSAAGPAKDTAAVRAVRPLRVSGYAQIHFRHAFATGADSLVDYDDFRVQRVRIAIEGDVSPKVAYTVEIDPRAPEITGVLRDAYLTFRHIPRHQLRIGQQKTQFGYENRESSTQLYVVNRAELSDALSRGINLRDVGVGLLGNLRLGTGWRLEDALTVVNGAGMNVQADDTKRKSVWGRLGLRYRADTRDLTARVGLSGASGDFIDPGDDPSATSDDFRLSFVRRGVDFELDHPRAFVCAEYVSGRETNHLTGELGEPVGWYATVAGKTRWRIGPIVRIENFDDAFKRLTIGAYLGLPAEPLRFMVNFERRSLKEEIRADDKLYFWTQVRF